MEKNVAIEKSDAFTNVHNSKDNISKEFLCFHLFPYILMWFNFFGEVDAPFLLFSLSSLLSSSLTIRSYSLYSNLANLPLFNDAAHFSDVSMLPCMDFHSFLHFSPSLSVSPAHPFVLVFFIQLSFLFMFVYSVILSFVKNNTNTRTWKKS